eukprot:844270-Amphidinium_carterae.1
MTMLSFVGINLIALSASSKRKNERSKACPAVEAPGPGHHCTNSNATEGDDRCVPSPSWSEGALGNHRFYQPFLGQQAIAQENSSD